jgi:hypothetical protein
MKPVEGGTVAALGWLSTPCRPPRAPKPKNGSSDAKALGSFCFGAKKNPPRPYYMNRTMTAMAMGQSQSVTTHAR